jgi:hypothetical protein
MAVMGRMLGGMVLGSVSLEGTDGAGLRGGGGELRCRGMESEWTSCFFSCSLFFFSIRDSYGRIESEWVLVFRPKDSPDKWRDVYRQNLGDHRRYVVADLSMPMCLLSAVTPRRRG